MIKKVASLVLSVLILSSMLALPLSASVDTRQAGGFRGPGVSYSEDVKFRNKTEKVTGTVYRNEAVAMLDLVNKERTAKNIGEVKWNDELYSAALTRVSEISRSFSHTRPDGTSWRTALKVDGVLVLNGENISYSHGVYNAEGAMTRWMNSKGHRDNILTDKFKSFAAACFKAPDGKVYWVQLFSYRDSGLTSSELADKTKPQVEDMDSDKAVTTAGGGNAVTTTTPSTPANSSGSKPSTSQSSKPATARVVSANVDKDGSLKLKETVELLSKNNGVAKTRNAKIITPETLKGIQDSYTGNAVLRFDTLTEDNKAVQGRLELSPKNIKTDKDINVEVFTDGKAVERVQKTFDKFFDSRIQVILMGEEEAYPAEVKLAVKLDKELNADSLVIYSYDRNANTYKQVGVNYKVDENGYLHITTDRAGTLIITDGALAKK